MTQGPISIEQFSKELYSKESLFSSRTLGYNTAYQELISSVKSDVRNYEEVLREKEYGKTGKPSADISQNDLTKIEGAINDKVNTRIESHRQQFVAAHERKVVPELTGEDIAEEVTKSGGIGLLMGMFSNFTGAIMGMAHHLALSVGMQSDWVKEKIAQAKISFSEGKEWAEAGELAKAEVLASRLQPLVGNDKDAAITMANASDEQRRAVLGQIKSSKTMDSTNIATQISEGIENSTKIEEVDGRQAAPLIDQGTNDLPELTSKEKEQEALVTSMSDTEPTEAAQNIQQPTIEIQSKQTITEASAQPGLSWAQIAASVPASLAIPLDSNKYLSVDELSRFDKDEDGKLTAEELSNDTQMQAQFKAMLEADENKAFRDKDEPDVLNLGNLKASDTGISLASVSPQGNAL